jgi:hypothetical protein
MKEKWQAIIESRPDYEHPEYPVSQWKRDALAGKTRMGYAQVVSGMLNVPAPLPDALKQFKPKSNVGKTVQRAVVIEFTENGACFAAKVNGHGWFAMRYAFENLIPFIVAKGEDAFIVARATHENRKDLRELAAEILYEWGGYVMVDYLSM